MRVLVTGGAGFIGSHVVDELVVSGHDVMVLDSFAPSVHRNVPDYLNDGARYTTGDVRSLQQVDAAARDVDAVAHLAAKVGLEAGPSDYRDYVDHNDLGTATLLQSLAGSGFRGRLVVASSMVVYGEGSYRCVTHGSVAPGPRLEPDLASGQFEPLCPICGASLISQDVTEEARMDPRNIYAATKCHQEHLAAVWARSTGASAIPLRYHNVYGPRMPKNTPYAGVASLFSSRLSAGLPPLVFEDGGQRRDFVHVVDVAHATVLALLEAPDSTGPTNVASGTPCTIGDVASLLADAIGPEAPRPIVTGRYRLGDVRHIVASAEKARRAFGFTARISLRDGVADLAGAN